MVREGGVIATVRIANIPTRKTAGIATVDAAAGDGGIATIPVTGTTASTDGPRSAIVAIGW